MQGCILSWKHSLVQIKSQNLYDKIIFCLPPYLDFSPFFSPFFFPFYLPSCNELEIMPSPGPGGGGDKELYAAVNLSYLWRAGGGSSG